MSGSKLRSRDRQRLRREVDAAVVGLPMAYVLEAMARRMKIRDGRFEARFRDGFLQEVSSSRRFGAEVLEAPLDPETMEKLRALLAEKETTPSPGSEAENRS